MTCKQWMILAAGAGIVFTASAQAEERNDLWGQGRVEVVIGGGSPGGPYEDCGSCRLPGPDRYPVYSGDDDYEFGDRDRDFGRGKDRWKDRAEAAREWEKARQEAFREREKDRQEWERERAKAELEAWKEEEKARREWEKEREKADREAWKERAKERRERFEH